VAGLVIWADRRFRLGRGRAFALYVAAYCAGRVWIEGLRIDTAEQIFGVRLNVWTSIVVFLLAVGWILTRRGPRETDLFLPGRRPAGEAAQGGEPSAEKVSLIKSDQPPDG
jgi:prolipoprotein diacylglyceryltransferase